MTYAVDRRGCGESQGLRGDIVAEETALNDYWTFIDAAAHLRGHHHNTPKFLIAHSLGALYAIRLCQKRPDFFKGCIVINPLLKFNNPVSAFTLASLKARSMLQYNER